MTGFTIRCKAGKADSYGSQRVSTPVKFGRSNHPTAFDRTAVFAASKNASYRMECSTILRRLIIHWHLVFAEEGKIHLWDLRLMQCNVIAMIYCTLCVLELSVQRQALSTLIIALSPIRLLSIRRPEPGKNSIFLPRSKILLSCSL